MGMRSPVRSHFCLEVEERRFLRFPSNSANSCFTPYAYGGNVREAPSLETREHSRHFSSVSPCRRGEIPFSVWDATDFVSTVTLPHGSDCRLSARAWEEGVPL